MGGLVTIDTKGNVTIGGNLFVAGKIQSSGLTLKDNGVLGAQTQNDTNSTNSAIFNLQNNQGTIVASVDASGSAQFANIQTKKLTGSDEDRGSLDIMPAEDTKTVQRTWESSPSAVLVSTSYKTQAWVTDITPSGFTIHVSDSPASASGKLFWWALW